ncbi:hypothetical protein EV200_104160 [Pedobacter psychrotolerans]|uniref:ATPase AAA-type core domain-containing protein n=1 Tax=Pedobacter psychrotolerans TaxID=1843235 RepID=A0A4R2HCW9_9SPHI|nr:ATP-binding protein [Pedobacter psychrotolerans]TCO25124.1 hypothetical protein EV200_104160 [Pedobacter psychrotolerans]GGE47952.1 hypothetical protein GCM10011413_12520 [Pedobacter psychrotolerans]
MLLEFKVANFRSIGEEQVLSLVPSENQKEYFQNILTEGNYSALNLISIYGANGSGKSNVLKAISVFLYKIKSSSKFSSTQSLIFDPFILREGWKLKPTTFEITFILNDSRYRYGFTYNKTTILKEWLFRKKIGREVNVFQREGEIIDPSSSLKGNAKLIDAAVEGTKDNALFLSSLDALNIEEATEIFEFFQKFLSLDGTNTTPLRDDKARWENEKIKSLVTSQIKRLNLGIVDIEAREEFDEENSEAVPNFKIMAKHRYYDPTGEPTKRRMSWDFYKRESSGSKKVLELSAPILAILQTGGVLSIDEIEANMHPLLTLDTINLFLNKETNPRNAQLIFTTHDTNLLSYSKLRRDQIYFAEKNNWESTELYSLSDFVYMEANGDKIGKERPDSDKEKRYIEGRYGAIPVFGRLDAQEVEHNG